MNDLLPNQSGYSATLYGYPIEAKLQEARVELIIPATLHFLPILCAALREYCAALPPLLHSLKKQHQADQTSEHFDIYQTASLMGSYSHLVYSLELALQEAASNIVRHGYTKDTSVKLIKLHLGLDFQKSDKGLRRIIVIELIDFGTPFNPAATAYHLPDPTALSESGYGLYLIHRLTDQLLYSYSNGQNHLRMLKFLD